MRHRQILLEKTLKRLTAFPTRKQHPSSHSRARGKENCLSLCQNPPRRRVQLPEISGHPDATSLRYSVLTGGVTARLHRPNKPKQDLAGRAPGAAHWVSSRFTPPKAASRERRGWRRPLPALPPRATRILRNNRYPVSATQRCLALPTPVPEVAAAISRRLGLALASMLILPSPGPRFSLLNCPGPAPLSDSTNHRFLPPDVSVVTRYNPAFLSPLPVRKRRFSGIGPAACH